MARMFTAAGTGSQQTLTPANKSKIPIYANETALDADLSNLPDGTICATSGGHDDVIDQMKDYIRKQNDLSDWEEITISTDSNNPTVMRYDGFFTFLMPMSAVGILNINEVAIFQDLKRDGSWAVSSSVTVPFNKGDNLYYSRLDVTPLVSKVAYYKDRDYTGR